MSPIKEFYDQLLLKDPQLAAYVLKHLKPYFELNPNDPDIEAKIHNGLKSIMSDNSVGDPNSYNYMQGLESSGWGGISNAVRNYLEAIKKHHNIKQEIATSQDDIKNIENKINELPIPDYIKTMKEGTADEKQKKQEAIEQWRGSLRENKDLFSLLQNQKIDTLNQQQNYLNSNNTNINPEGLNYDDLIGQDKLLRTAQNSQQEYQNLEKRKKNLESLISQTIPNPNTSKPIYQKEYDYLRNIYDANRDDIENFDPGATGGESKWAEMPLWLKQAMHFNTLRAIKESMRPYQIYEGERTAEPSAPQIIAKNMAYKTAGNKTYNDLFSNAADKLINLKNAKATDNIKDYMNPYQSEVINNLGNMLARNFEEKVLPSLNSQFISTGNWRGTGRERALNKAYRDWQETFGREAGQLMHQNYQNALNTSGTDLQRQMENAATMQDLVQSNQNTNLKNIDLINQIGEQEQGLNQIKLNQQYEDWVKEQNYGPEKTGRLQEILSGQPITYGVTTTNPFSPQASPYTRMGGIAQTFMGMNNMMPQGKKAGGRVRLAEGGMPGQMPDQNYQNDILQLMNEVRQDQPDPRWAAFTNMGASVAANNSADTWQALGEAMPDAVKGFNETKTSNFTKKQQVANLLQLANESRRYEEERIFQRELENAKLAETRRYHDILEGKRGGTKEPTIHNIKQGGQEYSGYLLPDEKGQFQFHHIKVPTDENIESEGLTPEQEKLLGEQQVKSIAKDAEGYKEKLDIANKSLESYNIIKEVLPSVGITGEYMKYLPNVMASMSPDKRNIFDSAVKTLAADKAKLLGTNPTDSDRDFVVEMGPSLAKTPEGNIKLATIGIYNTDKSKLYNQFLLEGYHSGYKHGGKKYNYLDYMKAADKWNQANKIVHKGGEELRPPVGSPYDYLKDIRAANPNINKKHYSSADEIPPEERDRKIAEYERLMQNGGK